MTISQMEGAALRVIESKGLARPSIQKRALGRIIDFLKTTGQFMNGKELMLPSDKGCFKRAFEKYIGRIAEFGEPTVINIIYRLSE